jgi:hypothetical protein
VKRGRKFGRDITARNVKTNSSPALLQAKVTLRQNVKAALGGPEACRVFDAFAGEGVLYRACWKDCALYAGCDEVWFKDERRLYVGDNLRVLRAIDLKPFNLFDLDAYGSCWEQAAIVAARRQLEPGERIGVVLTEGTSLKMRLGGMPNAMLHMAKLRKGLPRPNAHRGAVLDRAIANFAAKLDAEILHRWQAQKPDKSQTTYIGLVLEKKGAPEGAPEAATESLRRAPRRRRPSTDGQIAPEAP